MTLSNQSVARVLRASFPLIAGLALLCFASVPSVAQVGAVQSGQQGALDVLPIVRPPVYVVPLKPEISTLYSSGEQIVIEGEDRWRFMCGSNWTGLTKADLEAVAEAHYAAFEFGPTFIVDSGTRGAGINIVYSTDGSVPAAALAGFSTAELYIEDQFSDLITVSVSCNFASMGGGVLGATGSSYQNNVSWNNSRDGLQSGMDGDDVLQNWLPAGSTIPVRYNGGSSTVTNESVMDWTKANYRATIGSVTGNAGSMTYNTDFTWDYDPSNGISGSQTSFVDVVVHETGHALGFTSAMDFKTNEMEAMDIVRFQRTDGTGDYNPDTYAEFQTRARLVDYNLPNDDHQSDLIDVEYRMEDGSPYQGSHFRLSNNYGIMGPAISSGFTRYPNFYTAADKAMFDVIGYDYPPGSGCLTFLSEPAATQTVCEGDFATLSVSVQDPGLMDYQWRIGTTNLVDDGSHIAGATTDTLFIFGFGPADVASNYNCLVTNTALTCSFGSNDAELLLDTNLPAITQQPAGQVVTEGGFASFSIALETTFFVEYQWYKGAAALTNDGHYFGVDGDSLTIVPVALGDAGDYHCEITSQLGELCSNASDSAALTVNPAGNDCPEDLTGNGSVGLEDLSLLLSNYGITSGAQPEDGDIDGDGDIDLGDLSLLLASYGLDCPTQ